MSSRTSFASHPYPSALGTSTRRARVMKRKLLLAAAAACAAIAPALAYSQVPAGGTFTAVDTNVWRANGTDATTMTIATGETVTFEYPAGGKSFHGVSWTSEKKPDCPNFKSGPARAPWQTSCTIDEPGTYEFACPIHVTMTGKLI